MDELWFKGRKIATLDDAVPLVTRRDFEERLARSAEFEIKPKFEARVGRTVEPAGRPKHQSHKPLAR